MNMDGTEANTGEGWHTCDDGQKLYFKVWQTKDKPRARVVLVHGFGDHCNTFGVLFPTLASRGIEVFGFDQRGWGRSVKSPGERGRSGPTTTVLADISSVLKRFLPASSTVSGRKPSEVMMPLDTPLFLFGHSMGGAEVLHYASKHPNPYIRGYIVESPFIALDPKTRPWAITVAAGRMACKVMPNFQMKQSLNSDYLSRDHESNVKIAADPLCDQTATLEGAKGMLERGEELESGKVRVDQGKSIWVGHGTADHICAYDATKKWFDGCCTTKDRTFRTFDGWYHRMHDEVGDDKVLFAREIGDWILARV